MKTPRSNSLQPVPAVTRCAIYTRKSTDEGLDRDFNSLDAQRESAENFIRSQSAEGWEIRPDRYDDGGFSGGSMDRPALARLMADIEAGKVGAVVVYKIDRLSRSLVDFAQMMQTFEKHSVAFVSVTQQFNTATSMGRFILNILFSFAEFERAMISERTRDKSHASRRRGKWMGGQLPLGFDRHTDGGKLVVNPAESKRVRQIFQLFLEHGSIIDTVQEINRRGWTLKRWITKGGREYGGGAFDKFSLKRLLTNHVYVGQVLFRGEIFPAEHEAIVDREAWDRVQGLLNDGATSPRRRSTRSPALLAGILRCAACECAMTPTYSSKGRIRYRYYLCIKAHRRGWKTCPSPSIPATEIEKFVVDRIRAIGSDPDLVTRTVEEAGRQLAARKTELEAEAQRIQKNLDRAHEFLRRGIDTVSGSGTARRQHGVSAPAEKIVALEDHLACVRDELEALRAQSIDPDDLRLALDAFDPVWEHLTTAEQARVVQLLIERIEYDGWDGSLDITFHPAGVRTLATGGLQLQEDGA